MHAYTVPGQNLDLEQDQDLVQFYIKWYREFRLSSNRTVQTNYRGFQSCHETAGSMDLEFLELSLIWKVLLDMQTKTKKCQQVFNEWLLRA